MTGALDSRGQGGVRARKSSSLRDAVAPACAVCHQLIILGNGFDKACGLRSGFWEFFEPRMSVVRQLETKFPGEGMTCAYELREAGITAWDLVLYLRKDFLEKSAGVQWCDVESAIARVVGKGSADDDCLLADHVTIDEICGYIDCRARYGGVRNVNEYVDLLAERVEESESQEGGSADDAEWDAAQDAFRNAILHAPNAESEYVAQFLLDVHPSLEKGDRGAVAKALYDELRLLESQFAEYLRVDVERAEDYEKRSRCLLTDIYGYGLEQSCFSPKAECPLTVLSFNYTSPGLPKKKGRKFDIDFVNVHGRLDGEVIFGADGLDCLDDADVARFSKTYRVLSAERFPLRGSIAYPSTEGNAGGVLTTDIKFFGHSLARADYSYFQAIFDLVDLYAGSVRLFFLYTPHGENDHQELLDRVARLLNAYGETLDNAAHGKNLMHKLLLESRLFVQRVQ